MQHLLIFGLGYTASRLATRARAAGWSVTGTSRTGRDGTLRLDAPECAAALEEADFILSSVPPDAHGPTYDPVLRLYFDTLKKWRGQWLGYLSTTGVYGDQKGAWVDETSPTVGWQRTNRIQADQAWRELGSVSTAPVHLFRLPGIYGPGRSAIDRVQSGTARRIDLAQASKENHVFCRIHVDDIVETVWRSMAAPAQKGPEIFNLSDDEPASGNAVIEYACDLLGLPWPPLVALDDPSVSAISRDFYASWRRVRNDKIKHVLGVKLAYPTYREGLAACLAEKYLKEGRS
jgi:nucleoside-diphosphate-sugar epimerase